MRVLKEWPRSRAISNLLLSYFILRTLTAMSQVSGWAFGFKPAFDVPRRALQPTSVTPDALGFYPQGRHVPALPLSSSTPKAEGWAGPRGGGFASPGRCRRKGRRFSVPSMAKAAKDPDVVLRSVKVGPLKQENINLPSGVSMEAVCQKPSTGSAKRSKPLPPLVFIHGSYHAAWCWSEHWMAFLASRGYDTYSVSLRGTSGTPLPDSEGDAASASVKIAEHVADVRSFVETVLPGRRPVFVSHSFGGIVLLKLMEELANEAKGASGGGGPGELGVRAAMAGAAFLCSVPPSGNGPMTKRFIKERPVLAVKIVLGFVLKMATFWPWLARDLFFCQSLEQSALKRYMSHFQADSKNGLDLGDLRGKLPIKGMDAEGRASWIRDAPPRLVIGAERDRLVDEVGIREMATFLDTEHIMLPSVPHEVMLGPDWPLGVTRLLQWLEASDFTLSTTP